MWMRNSFKGDDCAQLHVLESVIAALLFFGALQAGVALIPDSQTTTALDTLSITGEDALRSLYLLDPGIPNGSDYDNSSLIYFVATGRTGNITGFLNKSLDERISYTLSCRTEPDNIEAILFEMIKTVDESTTAHFSFFHEGRLYDVRLILWKEPRGVA